MTPRFSDQSMRIKLSDEARERLTSNVQVFLATEFDIALSDFQASGLLDFVLRKLGPPVYNKAIRDARAFVHSKLDDLEGEFYEPEEPA